MNAIEFVYQELNSGRTFAKHVSNVKYPYLQQVLYLTPHGYIGFTHYGSSAVQNTIEKLQLLLKNIFGMSAEEFLENYVSVTRDYCNRYDDEED